MQKKLFSRSCVVLVISFGSVDSISAIKQEKFHVINELIVNKYREEILNETNNIIEISELWQDFGGAFKVDSVRKIPFEDKLILTLTGKVASHENIDEDGYALVVCHEIGHLLGGAPRQSRALDNWSSVEGEADYYATNKCMWDYLPLEPKIFSSYNNNKALDWCKESFFNDDNKIFGCFRIMSSIIAMQNYFNATSSKNKPVSIFEHEQIIAKKTLEKFPSDQCRIDTFLAGLLNKERPRCWLAG